MNLSASVVTTLSEKVGVDLSVVFFGNTLFQYSFALLLFVGLTILFKVLQSLVLRRLARLAERTATDIDDALIRITQSVRPQFYGFLALYFALRSLALVPWLDKALTAVLLIFIVYQAVKAVGILIDYIGEKKLAEEEESEGEADPGSKAAIELIRTIAKVVLWVFGFLLVLSNLGIEVTSLIAGLGIGGIAIAFAIQSILGDLFSSFAIYFDKPFKPGDFIVVRDLAGTVEKVGIKTTRLRALQGEEIVLPNADLTTSRIHNYKRMEKRRIVFSFGVLYETPADKVKKIPGLVSAVFKQTDNADLDRVHFKELGDSALVFETVYYVQSGEYMEYMDIQQNVNLALLEAFEQEGIGFAYPTQTVHLSK